MHPIAFHIGGFAVHWYGILIAAGVLLGIWTAQRRGRASGITAETIYDIALWLVVGGIVGARTLYVISYWKTDFAGRPFWHVFQLREGGLVYYGGFLGAVLAGAIYIAWKKLQFWKMADAFAPSIALGQSLGRLGCLMTGCCYGRPTSLPWGIRFPADHETRGIPVHPTQIYEAAGAFLLFVLLDRYYHRKRFDGEVFALYLICYALLRSVVELFRGDYPEYWMGWATPAHLVSIGLFAMGLILMGKLPRREKKTAGS